MLQAAMSRKSVAAAVAVSAVAVASQSDSRLFAADNIVNMALKGLGFAKKLQSALAAEAGIRELEDKVRMAEKMDPLDAQAKADGYSLETLKYPTDGAEMDIELFRPKTASGLVPLLIWFHGGGMCIGDAMDPFLGAGSTKGGLLKRFAGQVAIASVKYRLAPEYKFPTGALDAIATTEWLVQNAERLGFHPARVSVAGYSAGGYLAAVVGQASRDRGFALQAVMPITPMLRRGSLTQSFIDNGGFGGLSANLMLQFWMTYSPNRSDSEDPLLEPVRGIKEGRLPPHLVVTAEFCVLRDEGLEMYEALRAAGVTAENVMVRGTHVGFTADTERWELVLRRWADMIGVP